MRLMMRTGLYRDGRFEREEVRIEELDDLVRQDDVTVWVDYTSPSADDLAGIGKTLGLHRLAVEDAVHDHQRPKLDRYPGHLFLAAYHAELGTASNVLNVSEIKAFITRRALVIVHGPDMDPGTLAAHWDAEPDLAVNGTSFLLWGLLDLIVDGHFDTVQELDARIDSLEDVLFDDHAPIMTCRVVYETPSAPRSYCIPAPGNGRLLSAPGSANRTPEMLPKATRLYIRSIIGVTSTVGEGGTAHR